MQYTIPLTTKVPNKYIRHSEITMPVGIVKIILFLLGVLGMEHSLGTHIRSLCNAMYTHTLLTRK